MGQPDMGVNCELALDRLEIYRQITRMTHLDHMQRVEERAFAARKTVRQVCDKAGVYPSVWSRAKARGTVSVDVMIRMERALDIFEQERNPQ